MMESGANTNMLVYGTSKCDPDDSLISSREIFFKTCEYTRFLWNDIQYYFIIFGTGHNQS